MADYPVSATSRRRRQPAGFRGAARLRAVRRWARSSALVSAGGVVVAAPLMGLLGIIGVIVAYVKRDDARGTWVASHCAG